jgi:hypothetical protein
MSVASQRSQSRRAGWSRHDGGREADIGRVPDDDVLSPAGLKRGDDRGDVGRERKRSVIDRRGDVRSTANRAERGLRIVGAALDHIERGGRGHSAGGVARGRQPSTRGAHLDASLCKRARLYLLSIGAAAFRQVPPTTRSARVQFLLQNSLPTAIMSLFCVYLLIFLGDSGAKRHWSFEAAPDRG